jgi:hypothetical protein
MPQDIITFPNDLPQALVSERFRDLCDAHRIGGVTFIPCGRSRARGAVFVLWPIHRSECHAPVSDWLRGSPLKPGAAPYDSCHVCGRPRQITGYPRRQFLDLPGDLTISVPSISTEMRNGMDFRFFCSATVREIIRESKLRGFSFSPMQ